MLHIGKNRNKIFKIFQPKNTHKWSWPQKKKFWKMTSTSTIVLMALCGSLTCTGNGSNWSKSESCSEASGDKTALSQKESSPRLEQMRVQKEGRPANRSLVLRFVNSSFWKLPQWFEKHRSHVNKILSPVHLSLLVRSHQAVSPPGQLLIHGTKAKENYREGDMGLGMGPFSLPSPERGARRASSLSILSWALANSFVWKQTKCGLGECVQTQSSLTLGNYNPHTYNKLSIQRFNEQTRAYKNTYCLYFPCYVARNSRRQVVRPATQPSRQNFLLYVINQIDLESLDPLQLLLR